MPFVPNKNRVGEGVSNKNAAVTDIETPPKGRLQKNVIIGVKVRMM